MQKCQKLQFFEWPLEAGSKSESIPIHLYVKMPNFTAEIYKTALQKPLGDVTETMSIFYTVYVLYEYMKMS